MSERAIAELQQAQNQLDDSWAAGIVGTDEWRNRSLGMKRELDRLRSGGVPTRPKRKMPSRKVIAAHHDRPNDECWRCGAPTDALERGHLIDRWLGGLDGPQNLALICARCHRAQPIFAVGDEARALAWLHDGGFGELETMLMEMASKLADLDDQKGA